MYKVMPIEGTTEVNGSAQKTAAEVLPEVEATFALHTLAESTGSAFVGVHDLHVVRGRFPAALLSAWDAWQAENEEDCWNDRPDETVFAPTQLFAVIVLHHGGRDLEKTPIACASQVCEGGRGVGRGGRNIRWIFSG